MADGSKPKKPTPEDVHKSLQQAIDSPDVPKIYTNGFGLGISNADVFIVFQRFGQRPVAVLNLSYTLAKTLAQKLGGLVADFEKMIGDQNILTTDRISEAFEAETLRKENDKALQLAKADTDVH